MCVVNTYAIIETPQKKLRRAFEMQMQVVLSEGQESYGVVAVGIWVLFVGERGVGWGWSRQWCI